MFFRILALLPFVSLAISSVLVDRSFDDFNSKMDTLIATVLFSDANAADSDIKQASNTCPSTVLSEDQGKVVLGKINDLKPSLLNVCNCVKESKPEFDKLGFTAEVASAVKSIKDDGNTLMDKVLACTPERKCQDDIQIQHFKARSTDRHF
ncbi:hypothetical protein F5146DRAFT_1005970 [Armillaria mellea]|nr:hypothetical protein F5146DRAFT_1005970 [Armillaria mellea]